MNRTTKYRDVTPYVITGAILALLGACLMGIPSLASSEALTFSAEETADAQALRIAQGKSIIVDVPVRIKRASLADPQVADAIVLSPKQIYVTGKGYGSTNLTLWDADDQVFSIFDLQVGLDLDRLREQFAKLLPAETNIQMTVIHDLVTLSGSVSTTGSLNQALAIAEVFAPKKVINFLGVYPEPVAPQYIQPAAVEVIRGTKVNSVKFDGG